MDKQRFGEALRQLRERRGLTQEDVVQCSGAYKDVRSLRKIEAGEQRPKREIVITLLTKGLDELDASVIDNFLRLAGYEPLRESEVTRMGLTRTVAPGPVEKDGPAKEETQAGKPERPRIGRTNLVMWRLTALVSAAAGLGLSVLVRDPFVIITSVLYAALFADSVLLESAYEFRERESSAAALLAFAVVWPTGLAALWADTSVASQLGLWMAMAILLLSAILQWVLVLPALPPYAIVPTTFQSLTSRVAHLRNSVVYFFLLFAIPFWVLPVHCVAFHAAGRHSGSFCPGLIWLWALMLIYAAMSILMGHVLLSNLKPDPIFNRYLTLFWARAILYFLLCAICAIWYSSTFP